MNGFVISAFALSTAYRERLEKSTGLALEVVQLTALRRQPPLELLRTLRRLHGTALIPIEDPGSRALVSVVQVLAALTGARRIEVVEPDMTRRRVTRLGALRGFVGLAAASIGGQLAIRRCSRELAGLHAEPRSDVPPPQGLGVRYLNANLWFGLKAGGSVGHVAGVINALAAGGHRVALASVVEPTLIRPDVDYLDLGSPRRYGLPSEINVFRQQLRIARQLRRLDDGARDGSTAPSFIYQRMSLGNYAGVEHSRRLHVPLVLEYNGSEVWVARNWGRPLRFEKVAEQAEEACLRHAHLVVTISEVLRDELLARGVEASRIVTYPNGVDPSRFDPSRYDAASRALLLDGLGIPRDAVVVTFVGTFGQWHGAGVLAEAIRALSEGDPAWIAARKVHFLFVGDGLGLPAVRKTLSGLGCVTFAGLVPQADAAVHLAASDILVSPHVPNADGSRFFGSPTKLFEYMAMGKAIVASNLDQIGQVLRPALHVSSLPAGVPPPQPASSAGTVPAADSGRPLAVLGRPGDIDDLIAGICFAVDRRDWREALGAEARRVALERYTWERHVEAILAGLTRVFPPSRSG